MERKVVYICPDYSSEGYDIAKRLAAARMTKDELLTLAKNENFATVYSLDRFQQEFNHGTISDEGYIFFI